MVNIKRGLSFLLALVLLFCTLPVNALCEETVVSDTKSPCSTEGCTLEDGHDGDCTSLSPTKCETDGCTLSYGHDGECNNQPPSHCETEGCTLEYDHDGDGNDQLPTQCETDACTLEYGHDGECNSIIQARVTNQSTASLSVNISITIDGSFAKDKEEKYMAHREVTVNDADNNGIISLHDVLLCTHEKYYADYSVESPGYAPTDGGNGLQEIWGRKASLETFRDVIILCMNYGETCTQKAQLGSSIDFCTKEVTDGQYISIATSGVGTGIGMFGSYDNSNYGSYFIPEITVPKGKEVSLTLWSITDTAVNPSVGYNIYILDDDGNSFSSLLDSDNTAIVTTAYVASAVFTTSFSNVGSYVLLTEPKDHDSVCGASAIRIHVYDEDIVQISNAQISLTEDFTENLISSWSADSKEYTVVLPEITKNLFANISYHLNDSTAELTGKIGVVLEDKNSKQLLSSSGSAGKAIKSPTITDYSDGFVNALSSDIWFGVADKYVNDAVFQPYQIHIKRLPLLSSFETTGLFLTESFDPLCYEYTAIISDTAQSYTVKPTVTAYWTTTGISKHTIKVNGQSANNKKIIPTTYRLWFSTTKEKLS